MDDLRITNRDQSPSPTYFLSRDNVAKIGSLTIPFPFSALLGVLFILVLLIAAPLSVPISWTMRYFERRREDRLAIALRGRGRSISWQQAKAEVGLGHGTLIGEYLSLKGPFRLWWTPESIAEISPYPCCFEKLPWGIEEAAAFFLWCRSEFTDVPNGRALIVGRTAVASAEIRNPLEEACLRHRFVSVCPPSHLIRRPRSGVAD